jgi:uncharacterized protein
MSLYARTVPAYRQALGNLDRWLEQAVAYAEERGFDAETLAVARLAPDQFNLTRQIQSTCDTAKLTGARLAGVDAPTHEDGPATLAELRVRIGEVRDFLETLDPAAVDAAKDRRYAPAYVTGKDIAFPDYIREFGLPNFYFHLSMAYAILRHNGVKLGKRVYLGHLSLSDVAAE